ncbi:MAG: translation initiation factor [Thermoleophilaceae bacterium]|nr:translation initiation factor [Thermoleophilaceae bacterium]
MPVPRRFDRTPPERDSTRINERIRVPQVRLISETGDQVGVIPTEQALRYAQERDLDLVEVAAEARPPVCRVLDYSKYKYEQDQKAKAARKHQQQVTIREMKLRPKIATHDYETKRGHVRRFLDHGDKVKVTIMFRGRETTHPERGEQLLMRLAEDVADLGTIEQRPSLDGRNMTMVMNPLKAKERRPESDKKNRDAKGRRPDQGAEEQVAPEATPSTEQAGEAAEPAVEPDPVEPEPEPEPAEPEVAEPEPEPAKTPADAG